MAIAEVLSGAAQTQEIDTISTYTSHTLRVMKIVQDGYENNLFGHQVYDTLHDKGLIDQGHTELGARQAMDAIFNYGNDKEGWDKRLESFRHEQPLLR